MNIEHILPGKQQFDEMNENLKLIAEKLLSGLRGASGSYPLLELACTENVTLPVNTECHLTLTGACTVTLGEEDAGYASEWVLVVTQGETAQDIVLPVIHWTLGMAPVFEVNSVTEIRLHYAGDTLEGVWNG